MLGPVVLAAAFAAGCSIHPIPDNIAPSDLPTEEIVRTARCESRQAVYDIIAGALEAASLSDIRPERVLDPTNMARIAAKDPQLAAKFRAYSVSAIAYAFDFRITEKNNAEAEAGFKLPLINGMFDLGIAGSLNKTRYGQREFSSSESFASLSKLGCDGVPIRSKNYVYPITGSVGLYTAMNTFIQLSEIGGGAGTFTDTLVFTTKLHGEVSPKLVLNPVPRTFKLVNFAGKLDAQREDIHKLTVSLAFPAVDLRQERPDQALINSPQKLAADSELRAIENLCVARAKAREDEFGILRQTAPETYCFRAR